MEQTEPKVDKRTKEYKERLALIEEIREAERKEAAREGRKVRTELYICPKCDGTGKGEGCMEQGGFVRGLCPECCGHKMWLKGEKVAEEKIETKGHYEKPENNPGWKLCMYCGKELPPNEDGSPKWRKFPEPCYDCTWRNK